MANPLHRVVSSSQVSDWFGNPNGILTIPPSTFIITIGAGLTGTTATVGVNKVTTFTAGTGTVSFS